MKSRRFPNGRGKANPKNPNLTYKEIWSFPEDTSQFLEPYFEDSYSLHVCCGNSLLGDVRLDMVKQEIQDTKEGFIQGDMFDLTNILESHGIKRQSFEVVLCDPPWNLPYHVRHRLAFQLRDFVATEGSLIFNCLWFPRIRTMSNKGLPEKIFVALNSMAWRNVSLIGIYRKVQNQFD